MNFYDYSFIFLFVPLVVLGAWGVRYVGQAMQYVFLIAASLVFYATWDTAAPALLIGSVLANYALGAHLQRRPNRVLVSLAVAANLGLLGYFKYLGFFVENIAQVIDLPAIARVALPLGISFFTFQQISYLVDSHRQQTGQHSFLSYVLFIVLFPHLIAGPIVLQSDVLRQLNQPVALRIDGKGIAVGLAMFIVGLGKKILIADTFADYVSPSFAKAAAGPIDVLEGWQAALAYTFQIYFDFSGYSDMAVGLALCLGVRLPFNFNSPYKSLSIADFWRRWHMSLSRFLRHYLYFPLGGNRHGLASTSRNLLIVMVLGGVWHGANWTFVFWGALHGLFLLVNRFWNLLVPRVMPRGASPSSVRAPSSVRPPSSVRTVLSWIITFTAVVFAWVLFRSPDLATAFRIWQGMLGFGSALRPEIAASAIQPEFWLMAALAIAACLVLPNSQQIILGGGSMAADETVGPWWRPFVWQPNRAWALALGLVLVAVLICNWQVGKAPEFIYFNF
jgi:alginate O-acetyltransferase complex protein AlgI